jgi:hypothetical protein
MRGGSDKGGESEAYKPPKKAHEIIGRYLVPAMT